MSDEYINKKDVVDLGVMMQTHLWTREQTYNAIFCLPSADVAQVRHGRWIEEKLPMYRWGEEKIGEKSAWECSECHDVGFWGYNYCPNCGAKMDGDADD